MDKVISQSVIKAKRNKGILIIAAIVIAFKFSYLACSLIYKIFDNTREITTAVAEKGDVENTINASGEILPESKA